MHRFIEFELSCNPELYIIHWISGCFSFTLGREQKKREKWKGVGVWGCVVYSTCTLYLNSLVSTGQGGSSLLQVSSEVNQAIG